MQDRDDNVNRARMDAWVAGHIRRADAFRSAMAAVWGVVWRGLVGGLVSAAVLNLGGIATWIRDRLLFLFAPWMH